MKRSIDWWFGLTFLVWLATFVIACSDPIEIPNSAPSVTFTSLQASDGVLDLFFEVTDFEGDDVDLTIEICRDASCISPTAAPGGDGIRSLPTLPDEPVLHLFRWAAACDIPLTDFQRERVIRITPSDDQPGVTATSDPFLLNELGVVGGTDACNGID